jgi:hypothetical protein
MWPAQEARAARQKVHTQTVALNDPAHQQLIRVSEHLQVSKTALASRLLTVAIADAATELFGQPASNTPALAVYSIRPSLLALPGLGC